MTVNFTIVLYFHLIFKGIETDNFLVTTEYFRNKMYQIQIGTGNVSRIPLAHVIKCGEIDINPLTKTLYWSINYGKVIMKAQVDGSKEEVFKTFSSGTIYILSLILCQYLKQD
jgi:hypothetical protein